MMNRFSITPSPQRIEEASRAIRRHWDYDQRRLRRRAADRRQLKLWRAAQAVPAPTSTLTTIPIRRQHAMPVAEVARLRTS
jgi:hypothetical protein